ncbi:MAG: branched-chain amino acid ABC transporter permease [Christensenellales bacterium]|jgi:branched-chain amino acid transport system permease protein
MKEHFNLLNQWMQNNKRIMYSIVLIFAFLFPVILQDGFYRGVAVKTLMFMLMGTALNITNGYSGQFNIGFAGFLCIGAYTSAILMTRYAVPFIPAMFVAGIVTALFGMLLSLPTSRLSGMYLALVTLGFAEIIRVIALNFRSLTGGALGIKNIPNPRIFGYEIKGTFQLYYLILALLLITLFCCRRIIKSRIGRAWIAIRENQDAASSLGINLLKYKALNFMTSGFFAGIAGTFMASYYRFINSEMFMLDFGHEILVMVVLGGMGTFIGPIIGAITITFLLEVFRFASDYRMLIYSVLIVVVMWIRPQGIAGASNSILASRRKSRRSRRALSTGGSVSK